MRILHVINGLSSAIGGPPITLGALAPAQVRCGHEVIVLSARRSPAPLSLEPGVHGRLTVREAPTFSDARIYNPRILHAVRNLAPGCDILHIHGSWRYHLLAAAKV